jgi:4-hydroxymandelate oxidase
VALEEIAGAGNPGGLWFQLYPQPTREATEALVGRAECAGYRALVVTLDAPVNGIRNREQRARFTLPPGVEAVNTACLPSQRTWQAGPSLCGGILEHALTWEDLGWLRGLTRLPLVLKGVLHPEDAARALDSGVDGLVVSNHGGRTLDTTPASIEALRRVRARVGGRVPLLLDGGIRRGTDVLKALALGAEAVMIGRPYVHGLAAAGAVGVAHVVHILRAELEVAMALTGCRNLGAIGPDVLWENA